METEGETRRENKENGALGQVCLGVFSAQTPSLIGELDMTNSTLGWARPGRGNQPFAGNARAGIVTTGALSCSQASPLASASCDVAPAPCGVDVLGSTSLASNPLGILTGAQGVLTVTAGDACQFQPLAAYIAAYQRQADDSIANANRLPLLLIALDVGNVAMLRRRGDVGSGIITDPYNAQQATPLAIRTGPFSSTNEQNLTMTLNNVNNLTVHMFLDIWGSAIN